MRELIDAMEDNYSKWSTREGIRDLPEFDDVDEVDAVADDLTTGPDEDDIDEPGPTDAPGT